MQTNSFFIGPSRTPKSIKFLILFIAAASLISAPVTFFLNRYFNLAGPENWFSLSLFGLKQFFFWQPLTYFLINSIDSRITLGFLISLFIQMFLLWFTGSELAIKYKARRFLLFFLGAACFAGLVSAAFLFIFSSPQILFGSTPPVYAAMIIWAMLHAETRLYLFFFLRIQVKWLIGILIGFSLVLNLVYGAYIAFIADIAAIFYAFIIGRFFWNLQNPFPLSGSFSKKKKKHSKIIDITKYQSNDAFMDRMLDKIGKYGEASLSKSEKERMNKISKEKGHRP